MFGGGNSRDAGSWTGWLCDKDTMKTIGQTIDREGYLERYPKSKAISLNTLFTGFLLYHHGEWFELDRHGSGLAKNLIKHSSSNSGFWVTVEGVRKEGKIQVHSINEKKRPGSGGEYVVDKDEQNKNIRQDFKKMGI
jgi:hypothetical protein